MYVIGVIDVADNYLMLLLQIFIHIASNFLFFNLAFFSSISCCFVVYFLSRVQFIEVSLHNCIAIKRRIKNAIHMADGSLFYEYVIYCYYDSHFMLSRSYDWNWNPVF